MENEILKELKSMRAEIHVEIKEMKEDINALKSDVAGLKEDVKVLKNDVAELKEDIIILNEKIDNVQKEIIEEYHSFIHVVEKENRKTREDLEKYKENMRKGIQLFAQAVG